MHHRCVRFCGVKYVGFEIDSSSLLFHLMRVGRLLFEVASLEIFFLFFVFMSASLSRSPLFRNNDSKVALLTQ